MEARAGINFDGFELVKDVAASSCEEGIGAIGTAVQNSLSNDTNMNVTKWGKFLGKKAKCFNDVMQTDLSDGDKNKLKEMTNKTLCEEAVNIMAPEKGEKFQCRGSSMSSWATLLSVICRILSSGQDRALKN